MTNGIHPPHLILIGGPNGAGKSTSAPEILQGSLHVQEFVNADVIAHGLSAFRPEKTAMQAGRILLARIRELARQKADFAFETTLASRAFAPWILELKDTGYKFSLIFLWLESPELAIKRVLERVKLGGHHVSIETIKRRYVAGLKNFFQIYRPLADCWRFYNNSDVFSPAIIASGNGKKAESVSNKKIWNSLEEEYSQ
jgi:predicted ABC-type ATPase